MDRIMPLWRLELWLRAGDMLTSSNPGSATTTRGGIMVCECFLAKEQLSAEFNQGRFVISSDFGAKV